MYDIKKIIVPVDFSACSRSALDKALALAERHGARITVFHVADVGALSTELRVSAESGGAKLSEYAVREASADLERFLSVLPHSVREKLEVKIVPGRPRQGVLHEAREGAYDLLVMGTHGRTGRAHSLAGSITESVVRMAPCPVLAVREPD